MKQLKIDMNENNLLFGDCKDWLPCIPSNSVDLIYIDPPFFSNRNYEVVWGNGYELRSFEDCWKGGIQHYISWMKTRLIEAHRVLKNTGAILLHCDHHASHHLRLLLDDLFGSQHFQNEIIWVYKSGGATKKRFAKKHDNIYWYSKTNNYTFNPIKEKSYNRGLKPYRFKGVDEYKDNIGWHTLVNQRDVLNIDMVGRTSHERIGYQTQKPEALLKKMIKVCSNKDDVILDFFGGGGTTAKVCHDLERKFTTGDVSPVAYRVIMDRLKEVNCTPKKINPPLTRQEWLSISDEEFKKKICMFMGWKHDPNSKPVDGWVDKNKKIPAQIRNHKEMSDVRDIKQFVESMNESKYGVFVSWHYSKASFEYVADLEKKEQKKIDLVFAHTIIGELVLTRKQLQEYQSLYEKEFKRSSKRAFQSTG